MSLYSRGGHTPGPWTIEKAKANLYDLWYLEDGAEVEIGEICGKANAQLSAAAPEMLNFIQEIATLTVGEKYISKQAKAARIILAKAKGQ